MVKETEEIMENGSSLIQQEANAPPVMQNSQRASDRPANPCNAINLQKPKGIRVMRQHGRVNGLPQRQTSAMRESSSSDRETIADKKSCQGKDETIRVPSAQAIHRARAVSLCGVFVGALSSRVCRKFIVVAESTSGVLNRNAKSTAACVSVCLESTTQAR